MLPPRDFRLSKALYLLPLLALVLPAGAAPARRTHRAAAVRVVMLSDIHFDPFRDPSKFVRLRSAPASAWPAILAAPAAASDAAGFTFLQKACHARGMDTDWPLLQSSLTAAHRQQPAPLFVTVSGDLLAHGFDCRFHRLVPAANEADYSAFAAKTVAFVALQLHAAFPGRPVYIALGNNDSGCADYRETPDSPFLQTTAQSVAADLPADDRASVEKSFANDGDYSVALPAPMAHTRLIVLQDLFESGRYQSCASGVAPKANASQTATQQIAWLRAQLAEAQQQGQTVWLMAHIPPGVDVYSTVHDSRDVCAGQSPVMFLSSDDLADTITAFASTIRLVVLAHTHMDEMHLFRAGGPTAASATPGPNEAVPGKLVPSISPVNGNNPAFVVAEVKPHSAILSDYTVYKASNQSGVGTQWTPEYRYSAVYHEPDFSAASVADLVDGMRADKLAGTAASHTYAHWFFPGDNGLHALALRLFWPAYTCGISENSAAGYRACFCSAAPVKPAPSAGPDNSASPAPPAPTLQLP